MAKITRLTDIEELRDIVVETFMNKSSKITKVSNNSVLSGISFGIAKVGQKALTEISAVEAGLFPDTATGNKLDFIASNFGIAPRYTESESSTYIRVTGTSGTIYTAGVQTVQGSQGIVFDLEEDLTLDDQGFGYIKVRSQEAGSETNVPPLSLNTINPIPSGHTNVINEYAATGGRDNEDDDSFRKRIKEGVNILAKGTISMLEQAFIKINNNVLKIFYQGLNSDGNVQLAIATQNGIALTTEELGELLEKGESMFSLADLRPHGVQSYGIELINIEFEPIDINYRVQLLDSVNPDDYRKAVQVRMSKALDFRTFESGVDFVEWDDLLSIAKNTRGAKYVPDQFFFINGGRNDVAIDPNKLPRVRSFVLFDLQGNIIVDLQGNLSPVFFPNQVLLNQQLTALRTIS